jgi:hypothetical protein
MAGLLRCAEGRADDRREERAGALPGSARTGRQHANGELVSALDGNWGRSRRSSATRSRARRRQGRELTTPSSPAGDARFAARADDDPRLSHARPSARQSRSARLRAIRQRSEELIPNYGFTEADYDRKIFIDNVLGLEFATIREISRSCAHLLPDARRRVHAHLRSGREGLDAGAHRRAGQGDQFTPRRQARDPQQADRGRRLREVLRRQVSPAPSASASTAARR